MSELQITQNLKLKIQKIKNDVKNPNENSKNYVIFAPNGSGKTYFTKHIVEEWNKFSKVIIKFEKNDFINLRQSNSDIVINFKDQEINNLEEEIKKIKEDSNYIWNEIVSIIKNIKPELKNEINISTQGNIKGTILELFWSFKKNEIKTNIDEIEIEDKLETSDEEFIKKLILDTEETKKHNKLILEYHNQISDVIKKIKNLDEENIQTHKTIWLKADVNFDDVLNNYSEFVYNKELGEKYENVPKIELINKWISSRCKESLENINSKIVNLNHLIEKQTNTEKLLSEKRKVEKTIFNNIKSNTNKLKSILSKVLIHNSNIDIEIVIDEKNKNVKVVNFQEKNISQGEEESILRVCQ